MCLQHNYEDGYSIFILRLTSLSKDFLYNELLFAIFALRFAPENQVALIESTRSFSQVKIYGSTFIQAVFYSHPIASFRRAPFLPKDVSLRIKIE